MPEYEFEIWHSNPNAEQGGGDLLHPHKEVEGVHGPWVVFPNVDCAEAQGTVPLPHASVPLSALFEIMQRLAGTPEERPGTPTEDGVRVVAAERSIVDKINDPGKPTGDWGNLADEDQTRLERDHPGEVVRIGGELYQVPGGDEEPTPEALTDRYEQITKMENPDGLELDDVLAKLEGTKETDDEEAPAI